MFLYLLNISLPFHFVYFTVFGVSCLQAERSSFLLTVESCPMGGVGPVPSESFIAGGLLPVFW